MATDNTFSVPVVTGCGPGGSANIAVDTAIDTSDGLPSASGNNSLTLNSNFYFADSYGPHNQANALLAAFRRAWAPAPSLAGAGSPSPVCATPGVTGSGS